MTAPIGYPEQIGSLLERRPELKPTPPQSGGAGVRPSEVRAPGETPGALGPDFAEQVSQFVSGVDRTQKIARHQGEEFAVGHSNDIHGTMITVEQAEISLRILANVRNRVVDLYREVMRMGS
jgi:flagellar hook-basal body complex protein FliE